ncbi:MAG: hypothetical protein ABIJ33_05015 [Patescibacteria group bacterium]|nr:hypothetical protein [Patescibacteria group bacterium]
MIKTQVYLTESQMMALKEVAQKQGKHYAELFRTALADYLKKMKVTRKKKVDWAQVAREYAEPMGGISQKIDEELYQ